MQPSFYVKAYPEEKGSDRMILFSTKRASLVLVERKTYEEMKGEDLLPEDEGVLKDLGLVVTDRDEEKKEVLGLFDRVNKENSELRITVVLNLDCNFSCTYCYEGDMKGNLYMSRGTAGDLIRFIKARLGEDTKSLLIDFYGGEPLLSIGLLKDISEKLGSIARSNGISYRFTVVTNGSLFRRKVAEELLPLGLESVKITLDGPPDVHNRSRPFKGGGASFDAIIQNIHETCDTVKISIGGNFTEENHARFVDLLDYLMQEGLTPDRIYAVKFDPVMRSPETDTAHPGFQGGCITSNEPWVIEAFTTLRGEILKRGYNTPKITPIFCVVENRNAFTVNFDGTIYKCPTFIGKKGFEVGDIKTGVNDYAAKYNLDLWKNAGCADCEYLPLCFGGCRYISLVRDGNLDAPDCKKAYFDAALETFIKQDIRYRLNA
jgi:uncharacterized protein